MSNEPNQPIGSPFPRGSSSEVAQRLPEPEPAWRWSWSPFIGIKYGPIPVGLFVAIPIILAMAAR